jgi:hypothetical protein
MGETGHREWSDARAEIACRSPNYLPEKARCRWRATLTVQLFMMAVTPDRR